MKFTSRFLTFPKASGPVVKKGNCQPHGPGFNPSSELLVTVLSPECDTLAQVNPSLVRELGRGTEGRPRFDPRDQVVK